VVHIEFRDTGPGLAQGQAERIFDAFYTTKSHGKGTGLGLSICRDIIEKYGGTITAENVDGAGAVFTVELPLTKKVLQQDQQR
jgi:signal transduction histidine kinase